MRHSAAPLASGVDGLRLGGHRQAQLVGLACSDTAQPHAHSWGLPKTDKTCFIMDKCRGAETQMT